MFASFGTRPSNVFVGHQTAQRMQLAFAQESKKHSCWGVAALNLCCLICSIKLPGQEQTSLLNSHDYSLMHLELASVLQAMHKTRLSSTRRSGHAGKSLPLRTQARSLQAGHEATCATQHSDNEQDANFQNYTARLALHHTCVQMRPKKPHLQLASLAYLHRLLEVCD